MMLVKILAKVLRKLRIIDFDLIVDKVELHPEDDRVRSMELVLVKNGDIQKWACFKCPGGCGQVISLSLNSKRRPSWSVVLDWLGRPTVHPSVHQLNECGCHFWIKSGRIEWCPSGKPKLSSPISEQV